MSNKKYKVKDDFIDDMELFMCLDLRSMNKKGLTLEEWVDDYHIRENYLLELPEATITITEVVKFHDNWHALGTSQPFIEHFKEFYNKKL